MSAGRAALERALMHAPFLRRLAQRMPALCDLVANDDIVGALAAARALGGAEATVARALRVERHAFALVVAVGDLAGLLTLEQVVAALSDFADRALDAAIRAAILERTPDEEPRGFAALALGKHGSRELNYSSDIDPILIFDPDTLPRRAREEPVEAAVRIARRVVELLQSPQDGGHVLRVDLRLRPSPEATPLALPINAAITYYEASALPWERAAFIRARAAAGDIALGREFLATIRPFVWRRTLDYGAIEEIRSISRRIRQHHAQGQALAPGFDLKRGRGGIREVEFFAQIHQLIFGGRDPALRAPATLDALVALRDAARIDPIQADALADAYRLYRTIEHRLQMVEDQQTHRLPKTVEALDNVARLHGLADGKALIAMLRPHVATVGTAYDALEPTCEERLPTDASALEPALAAAGFDDAAHAAKRIAEWRGGGMRALRSPAAQEALERLLPALIAAFGASTDPMHALRRFDEMLGRLPSAVNLLRLLEARPQLVHLLGDILGLAPALADALGKRPALLDGLLDASALEPPGSVADLARALGQRDAADDYQKLLDLVRERVGELRFAQGVQIVAGAHDPLEVSQGYGRIAEAALETLATATIAEFEATHGRVPGAEFVILALGRFGGGALTHASDLDIVYLFSGDYRAESDGRKPLGATHYFNRLAQRVSAALSVPTAAGPLYEVDTRLRPSGNQGLLAVSLDSFARYQRESAWTWEHMALTRARPVFGSAAARAALQAIIAETLHRERDIPRLIADAVKMRGDIAKHKPSAGPFDVKLIDGGLVDLEFAVHVTQLARRDGFVPELGRAVEALADAAALPPELVEAGRLLSRLLVTLRLVAPGGAEPSEAARPLVASACGQPDWPSLVAAYEKARACVREAWSGIARQAAGDDDG
ncbi:MAG: bifunctional [glutamine synthetase] adenylyltransferase/[glutamine synthetase]-adenylyl-L-tyrosine phosphorylase [Sphingomonadaceae bacterium]|nr:bifunctional [glutamine synthetase] adenylyltransferase/[glutamine synthetase]-adenylyl-L-tyrosine phosphorylase [Sphingomonadaceae bacterium]